ncbi:MAG: hypothetical protein AB7O44_03730 [Hyphomicrobiaceae bacterium]
MVELKLADQIEKRRCWWFLNEAGRCELCLSAPDQSIDLFREATLLHMIYIWRGDLPLARAFDTGRLRAHEVSTAQRALSGWLGISPLAHVQSARADAQAV